MDSTSLLAWGIVAHLIADWLFQNDWMAREKVQLGSRASVVHMDIHALAMCLVFPVPAAIAIAVIHMLIDTRKPLVWWRDFYKQTDIPMVAVGCDQTLHIAVIAGFALLCGR